MGIIALFERELIHESTMAGLAQAAMAKRDTSETKLCKELGIRPVVSVR